MTRRSAGVLLATLVAAAAAPSSQTQEPRFRGGTNLVRLDVYATADGKAVTDLTVEDFEVFEDNAAQTVTSFELIRARGAAPDSARREPNTVAEARSRAQQPDTRLFVLFLDTLHTHVEGSYHAQNPIAALLDRVVGEDDLVGVMTPEISARNIAFSPRTVSVGRMLRDNWTWGERQSITPSDPRERELEDCYPDASPTTGIAPAMIQRRRESRTLASLEDLIQHLEGLREERTFVLLLTEGWLAPRPDPQLAGPIKYRTAPARSRAVRTSWARRRMAGSPWAARRSIAASSPASANDRCSRTKISAMEFELLMRRANRANVSFYPIDPRGLVVFDTDLGPGRIVEPVGRRQQPGRAADRASPPGRGDRRRGGAQHEPREGRAQAAHGCGLLLSARLRVHQPETGRQVPRKLTVKVKRPGVALRSRPGYLAPSATDFSAAAAPPRPQAPAGVEQALARLPGGRRPTPLYVSASGGAGDVRVNLEVDRATAATAEWSKGASVRVEIGPADGVGRAQRGDGHARARRARVHGARPGRGAARPGPLPDSRAGDARGWTHAAQRDDRRRRAQRVGAAGRDAAGLASWSGHRTTVPSPRPTRASAAPSAWWSRRR